MMFRGRWIDFITFLVDDVGIPKKDLVSSLEISFATLRNWITYYHHPTTQNLFKMMNYMDIDDIQINRDETYNIDLTNFIKKNKDIINQDVIVPSYDSNSDKAKMWWRNASQNVRTRQ